jgi:eukaryotic-like serine/threonine-protein kinase
MIRCLERDVRRRLRDIGEARILLEDPTSSATDIPIADAVAANRELRRPLWRRALAVAAVVLLATALGVAAGWYWKPVPAPTVTRFRIALPDGVSFTSPARQFLSISPDGTRIVFVGNGRLYSRLIDEVDAKPIPGMEDTEAATHPTISPDGRSVVFWAADLTIKRIPITGGAAVTVCQSENPFGISWTEEGIVIGQGTQGVMRVSPSVRAPRSGSTRHTDE